MAVLSVCNLIAATARTGDTILTMRAVEPRDKSFAMGVAGTVIALLGMSFVNSPFGYSD